MIAMLEETLHLSITPHGAFPLQDVRQHLVLVEDVQHLLARDLRWGLKLSLNNGDVVNAPNFLEATLEAKRADALRITQIAHLLQLNLPCMVSLVAHEVSDLLNKLRMYHHFP